MPTRVAWIYFLSEPPGKVKNIFPPIFRFLLTLTTKDSIFSHGSNTNTYTHTLRQVSMNVRAHTHTHNYTCLRTHAHTPKYAFMYWGYLWSPICSPLKVSCWHRWGSLLLCWRSFVQKINYWFQMMACNKKTLPFHLEG